MASTFLDEKISSFIEDKFPEFVKNDHPVFVEFLREYYKFLEAAKITLTNVQQTDQILLENKLTTNYLANEQDDSRFVYETSVYGAFLKDEIVTGQTSGATATILAEDNANNVLYIEANRHFQVGEIITGGTSDASATIGKYQGNPVQTIQQLLEYVDVDTTINDYLDQFREAYLTAVPNTLATGVSKRKLIKSVRDLYRAKGTRRAHEAFFRLMFNETPELTYPTENILKISAGDWSSDTVLRVVATENDPNNLVGQTITQTVNVGLGHEASTANVEAVLQLQEGETTVYQLILNVASIDGTFNDGAEISGIDNSDADVSITATVQPILVSATVTEGAAGYTTDDTVTITSDSGQNALISIVDVGSGEIGQIVIDNPGSNYTVGDPLFFDNTNTEGAGASAIVSCVDGAIAPEAGDVAAYEMDLFDHIVYEDGTEITDAYTGNQIQIESGTLASLSATSEAGQVCNVTVFSPGSGYEVMPKIKPATHRLSYNQSALTSTGIFIAGETITNDAVPAVTATITTFVRGKITIAERTGAFATGQVITGSQSNAKATLTAVDALGANATFLGWSTTGLGAISGVEVSNFGTGFTTAPTATVPVKMLLTRNTNVESPPDITLATAFSSGDTIIGQESSARGVVTAWDNSRQTLTVRTTLGTFQRSEILTRGSGTNYAIVSEINQGALSTTIGTIGTTAGQFNNDKGKISESLMRIQDSYYYQDFSYVVKVGAAIADWRAEIKKAVHPAGFAMFGEVSISNKVATLMTVPVTGITSYTPTLASLFEAVLTTVVGRRLGTDETGTAVPQSVPVQYPVNGNTTNESTSITNITTTNLAVGHPISGLSLPVGTTISVINVASSGAHNNGTITVSAEATASSTGETFWVSVPYTTEYSITNTLLGETEIKGTTNHVRGTLKRGSHLGHEPQLFSTVESITRSGTTATVETTGPHGVTAGEQVEISGVTTTGYDGVYEVQTATDDTFTITVSGSPTSPATVGVGKVKLLSPFDNSTRDVTLRPHTDVTVYPLYGDWASAQKNRYGLGPRQTNAIKYMWATPPTEYSAGITDTTENHQIILENDDDAYIIQEPEVLDRVDFTVTAASGKFIIDGVDKPALNLDGARYYRFDLSSSTTSTHPFKLSEVSESGEYNEVLTEGIEFDIELETGSYTDHTVTGNTTSGSNTITNITTTLLGVGNKISGDFYSGIPVGATIASIVTEGSSNNGSITISSNATATKTGATLTISEYGLGQDETHNLIAEDGEKLLVQIYDRVTSYGTQGSAGAYVEIFTNNLNKTLYYYCGAHSGMGNSLTISERTGDYLINEAYQLGGESAVNNILLEDGGYILYETDTDPETQSVMVSEDSTITYGSITEDLPSRLDGQMAYAYPNIIRRESPESGTDNVDAGGAGVYDTTMNYTNIQIGDHESNVHNRISDFADVRIVDIIKCGREFLEIGEQTNKHEGDNDYEFTLMEDGSYIQMEAASAGIPTESRKIWNVPPPSYIRLTTS